MANVSQIAHQVITKIQIENVLNVTPIADNVQSPVIIVLHVSKDLHWLMGTASIIVLHILLGTLLDNVRAAIVPAIIPDVLSVMDQLLTNA